MEEYEKLQLPIVAGSGESFANNKDRIIDKISKNTQKTKSLNEKHFSFIAN